MVCSGFLIGTQFKQGSKTLGMMGFFISRPAGAIMPPIGGGGGTGGAPGWNKVGMALWLPIGEKLT